MDLFKFLTLIGGLSLFLFGMNVMGQALERRAGSGQPVNALAAALILADKADVRRSRVRETDPNKFDIHDRVNYSVTKTEL